MDKLRIFFGHQSVGQNIIDGISEQASYVEQPFDNIIEDHLSDLPADGFLLHCRIGKNQDPLSKCRHFQDLIIQQLHALVDIALFKFCYIDIDEKTDIDFLFSQYAHTMDQLNANYPHIAFMHTTVPLRHTPDGLGTRAREILGRINHNKLANIRRNQFNALLVGYYGKETVFDLAGFESTLNDGKRSSFKGKDKQIYYSLADEYTNDGGHLNAMGREKLARGFMEFITNFSRTIPDYRAP